MVRIAELFGAVIRIAEHVLVRIAELIVALFGTLFGTYRSANRCCDTYRRAQYVRIAELSKSVFLLGLNKKRRTHWFLNLNYTF